MFSKCDDGDSDDKTPRIGLFVSYFSVTYMVPSNALSTC